jgi:hypothetical protein
MWESVLLTLLCKTHNPIALRGFSSLVDSLAKVRYNKHMNKQTPLSQASDLKQVIHLLDQAAKLMYNLDVRLSDFNAVKTTIVSLEADLTDLLESGQM